MEMIKSYYPSKSIKTIIELSDILNENANALVKIANNNANYHKPNPQKKSDGTQRMTYIVRQPLKRVQSKIKNRLLNRVHYAEYLFSGIKGKNGIKANAEFHCKQGKPKILISLDIKKFYPSITESHIKNVWLNFFKFSEPVAELLTKLTIFSGELPQGASTSPSLANLIFCGHEALLVKQLKTHKATYTRYADDISVTLHYAYSYEDLNNIISLAISFLYKNGFKINRDKFEISPDSSIMLINKSVCINNAYLSLCRKKRNDARMMVHRYKEYFLKKDKNKLEYEYQKIMGFLTFCLNTYPHVDIKNLISKMKNLRLVNC